MENYESFIDYDISPHYMELFRDLVYKKIGIHLSQDKNYLLKDRITRTMRKHNYNNIQELYEYLNTDDVRYLDQFISMITTGHTFFFREKVHLKILSSDIKIKKILKPIIWCAACSTGEEVYSIAIELIEKGIDDFLIIASDISKEALLAVKKGKYHEHRFKDTPLDYIQKYFTRFDETHYFIKDFIKQKVIVKRLNLIHPIQFQSKLHYIFCRNVLIYFDLVTQKKVINMLIKNLDPLGYLFVSHSESLFFMADKLESVFTGVYNKKA